MYDVGQFTPMLDQKKDDVENISFVQNSFKSSSEFNLSYFMDP